MPLPLIAAAAVPILEAVGAGVALGAAHEAYRKASGYVKENYSGEAASAANEKDNKRLTKEFESAKRKKLAAQKQSDAKKKADAKKRDAEDKRLAAREAKREEARQRVEEKKEDANARQFNSAELRATRDAAREERRSAAEAQREADRDAKAETKQLDAFLKAKEAEWKKEDELRRGPQIIVDTRPPAPGQLDPFRPPPAPVVPPEKKLSPVTEAQKKSAARASAKAYAAQTRSLVLGQIGSGGRGTLDWLAEHSPGAVEARQSKKDAEERAATKREEGHEKIRDEVERRKASLKQKPVAAETRSEKSERAARESLHRQGVSDAVIDEVARGDEFLRQ